MVEERAKKREEVLKERQAEKSKKKAMKKGKAPRN